MTSFSFTFEQRPGDTGRLAGTARLRDGGVSVEWMRETQFFPRQTQVREIQLAFADIESATYEQGWFRAAVTIQVRRLELIRDAAGVHPSGGLALRVERSQRDEARKFISILELKLSEDRLQRARDPLDT